MHVLHVTNVFYETLFFELKKKSLNPTLSGISSGFYDLDSFIQGFQKSDLIIIAGRPSMGKTAFSLNLGQKIIENYKIPLIIFSLEMSRQQVIYRFLSTMSDINATRLKSGKMTPEQWKKLGLTMKDFLKYPVLIDDNPNVTVADIRSKLRQIFNGKLKGGIVIVDYLQLLKSTFKLDNRVQEISHMTRTLKGIAKEFNIPVIVLSQLSRAVESRTNKRPMLSDLRESGCIANVENVGLLEKPFSSSFSWNKKEIILQDSQIPTHFEFKGIKPTFILTFENLTKIELTSNHKILSKKGWIRVSELDQNESVYCLLTKHLKTDIQKYTFHKIIAIDYSGLNHVYDRTIPIFHNYINKNFIIHNSIEQDADIVIMLYREEYYTEKKSELQTTELIIAKHRNGPIGTAKLLFKPSTTAFRN